MKMFSSSTAKIISFLINITFLFASSSSFAAEEYVSGNISNLTAIESGIMIMMDKGMPDNCKGSPYGWMLIENENSFLGATVLSIWLKGKRSGTIYTSGRPGGKGFCIVNQFDPAG
ncbi:hypothetical protein M3P05_12500 [Sansalvadorimonas sp. 2012CJ34-2]|uniref:Uncharacterized protein n=1 Tax=Parendozoicomonas callyspongiae TaxID=2942213 RepID=A0ABT0PHA4_9GAMM|nr:hypothetical protein [Sansalvadorimonas sp. 2012CJ34-2]MCL6270744.1 hypothetical protein [Sansalvadorimonas sp. 2012CJ34-2]